MYFFKLINYSILFVILVISSSHSEKNKTIETSFYGSILAGQVARANSDILAAANFYSHAADIDPNNPRFLSLAIESLLASGQVTKAIPLSIKLLELIPNSNIASSVYALEMVNKGKYSDAINELQKKPSSGIKAAILPILTTWLFLAQGVTEEPLKIITKLAENGNMIPMYNYHLALMNDWLGNKEEAKKRYINSSMNDSRIVPRVIIAAGSFFERTKEDSFAKEVYSKLEIARPNSSYLLALQKRTMRNEIPTPLVTNPKEGYAEALFNAASALRSEGLLEASLAYVQMTLYLHPNMYEARLLLADLMRNIDQKEKAISYYKMIPETSHVGWSASLKLAETLAEIEKQDQAEIILKKLAEKEKSRLDALATLGDIMHRQKKYVEAVKVYDQAINRLDTPEPNHWSLLYARGMAHERLGDWEKAEKDFKLSLELSPNQPLVLNYLGYSWIEKGLNLDEAKAMIENAVMQRPNDGYIIDSLGWALYQLGDYEEAVKKLENAAQIIANDAIIIDHLGDALWKAKHKIEARFQWKRALLFVEDIDLEKKLKNKIKYGLEKTISSEKDI